MENRKDAPATALAATSTANSTTPASSGSGSGSAGGGSKSSNNRRNKRSGGKGGGSTGGGGGGQGPRPSAGHNQQQPTGQQQQQPAPGGRWPSYYNPWAGTIQMWPGGPRPPLVPIPVPPHLQVQQQQALLAQQQQQALVTHSQAAAAAPDGAAHWVAPGYYNPVASLPSWDPTALASAFSTTSLTPPPSSDWYFDSGATSHMTSQSSSLSHILPLRYPTPSSIVVGNGSIMPVTATGSTELSSSLRLNNVLVSPQLIKNLISVRQFTIDNNCSVEFDPAGCSVKVLLSWTEIVRCNSSGPLYPLCLPPAHSLVA